MKFELEFEGLDELIKSSDKLLDLVQKKEVDRKIVERCGKITKPKVKTKIPRATDHSKSGRKSKGKPRQIPSGAGADNIPVTKPKKSKSSVYVVVGWDKGDNDEHFYMKFLEWGTSKIHPLAMFQKTKIELDKVYLKIAEEEYQKAIDKTIGR